MIRNHSLQAFDNLSLLTCVNYPNEENPLHALTIREREIRSIKVKKQRTMLPFNIPSCTFGSEPLTLASRHATLY